MILKTTRLAGISLGQKKVVRTRPLSPLPRPSAAETKTDAMNGAVIHERQRVKES